MWMIYPAIVGFVSSLVTMPWLISWLKQMHLGQMIQEDVQSMLKKNIRLQWQAHG